MRSGLPGSGYPPVMSIADTPAPRPAARNLEAGLLLVGIGAVLLLVSLFLEWYEPGIEAWDVFEVWDLVLAALAIAALLATAGRLGYGPPRPNSWLFAPAAAAFVVVVAALLDHPPAADAAGNDPGTGLWLALVAALLMAAGTVLALARISVALNVGDVGPVATPHHRRFGRDRDRDPHDAGVATPPPVAGAPPTPAPSPTEPTRPL